ncbi:MAG: leucine-rich repeat protein [Oscillospiraceae bacterium]|nr:leucine-rich repeat protein [Oscillospiraceae bacterium]
MMKKTVSAALSAMICASVLLTDSPLRASCPDVPEPSAPVAQPTAAGGPVGKNSLARYLADQGAQNSMSVQNLNAPASEQNVSVSNLKFDEQTGKITVISSQSYACRVRVLFVDEDNPARTYQLEADVDAGSYVMTELQADLSALPAYYTIHAQLVNHAGLAVCQPFSVDRYTREMQQILDTTAADFNAEQVVNFDSDETTNFIVLSEDTVLAEHDAQTNVLVSADYDRDSYVFSDIDDTVRSLKRGQYFYIQPTAEDIISIRVRNVAVDGDTATVTGDPSAEIGDMFDFIKIETSYEMEDSVTVSDPAWTEEYLRQYLDDNSDPSMTWEVMKDKAAELWDSVSAEPQSTTFEWDNSLKATLLETDHVKVEGEVKPDLKLFFHCYKVMSRVHAQFWVDLNLKTEFKTTLTISENKAGSEYTIDPSNFNAARPEALQTTKPEKETHVYYKLIPVPNVPGLFFEFAVDLSAKLSMKFQFGWSQHMILGIDFDSDTGVQPIAQIEPIKLDDSCAIEGELKIETTVSVGITFAKLIDLSAGIGGELDFNVKAMTTPKVKNKDGKLKSGSVFFMPPEDPGEPAIHACDHGLDIEIKLSAKIFGKVGAGFKLDNEVEVFQKAVKLLNELRWELELDFFKVEYKLGDFHVPVNKTGRYSEIHLYKVPCPNRGYRVTINVQFRNVPAGYSAFLKADSDEYSISGGSQELVFYATPGQHSCSVIMDNGNQYSPGACGFTITNKPVTITLPVEFTTDENPVLKLSNASFAEGEEVPPLYSDETEDPELPSQEARVIPDSEIMVEIVKLGKGYNQNGLPKKDDNIIGILYRNGVLEVIGYGEMYDFDASPLKHIKDVRVIMLDNYDPEGQYTIKNIGNSVFSGASQAEYLYIPDSVTKIGSRAFEGCEKLRYARYGGADDATAGFVLPPALTDIGVSAFSGCKSAAFGALTIPQSVQVIDTSAFRECNGITALNIPGNPETGLKVSSVAFFGCKGLKKITLGENISSIGSETFSECSSVEEMVFPFSLVKDSLSLSWHLAALFDIGYSVPDQMYQAYETNSIGFSQPMCVPNALKKVTFTDISEIPERYFNGMKMLESVTCVKGIEKIGGYAFQGCRNLKYIGKTGANPHTDSFVLPDTLQTISSYAFADCTDVKFDTLIIPESVRKIEANAFSGCQGLKELIIPGKTETVQPEEPDAEPVVKKYPAVTSYTFSNCKNLKKVVLGSGVSTVSREAFQMCTAVEEMTFSTSVVNEWIDTRNIGSFFNASITVPEGMYGTVRTTSMNGDVYCVPDVLKKVTLIDSEKIDHEFFENVQTMESLTLPATLKNVEGRGFKDCNALENVRMIGEPEDWEHVTINGDNDALKAAVGKNYENVGYDAILLLADPETTKVYLEDKAVFYALAAGKYELSYLWQYSEDEGRTWKDTDCTEYKIDIDYKTLEGRKYRCLITDEKGTKILTDNSKPADDPPAEYARGDVNGDGSIDVTDAILLARFCAEDPTVRITSEGMRAADADRSGNISLEDVVTILKIIVKLIVIDT